MVAMSLLALLATVALPLTDLVKRRSDEAELRRVLVVIRSALDAYKAAADDGRIERSVDASGYPPDLRALVDGVEDKKSPDGARLYFLRKLPADPMCECDDKVPEDTWETRSYASDPDSFSSGEDVFDIRSTNRKEGLNGVPYNQW
ncbi:putative general secretion pathway protein G [Burkholderia ambifaria AMMD]|nr:general secretion pathway protein GspG [Burkholderia ambifaria]AJY23033.1 putative general secretion pathway protein G [Burkholderia ambifaria AMMD]MBR7929303.1 general secretion pathway protein GspG [Burkholderia ambifaria]MBR8333308.1 general secretion pathway protein GspG [Burkholderia ambifaria]QQC05923.1 general secretion pathway protein GspG [Burkholderia ambifaria]UZU06753.1 general secretion pathway protein GspG [Burkholderia ambifaria]